VRGNFSRAQFPERFGSIQDARGYCHVFFPWYNTEHRRRASRGYSTGREDVRRRVA